MSLATTVKRAAEWRTALGAPTKGPGGLDVIAMLG
jgi:hypothetical protein